LFTGICTMQHVLVSGCSKYIMTASNINVCTQFNVRNAKV